MLRGKFTIFKIIQYWSLYTLNKDTPTPPTDVVDVDIDAMDPVLEVALHISKIDKEMTENVEIKWEYTDLF